MARVLQFGPFRLDLASRELWRGNQRLDLTPKAMEVLVFLVEHADQVVTRDQLFDSLWPGVFVADHALSVQILEIRRALGDTAQQSAYIQTRHRRGYRFCAPVHTVEDRALSAASTSATSIAQSSGEALVTIAALPIPRTRYANSNGVNIAYQVFGDGPVDLVFVMGWVSHLEYFWTEPRFEGFLRRLGSFSRVVLFDKRGTGLSDRVPLHQLPTIEQRMEDVHAVMDSIGSQRAVICGVSEGGCMSAVFAATYPERAVGLIMIGTYARRIWAPDYPWAPTVEHRQEFFEEIRHNWGGPVGLEERAPSVASDPNFREWWATYLRMGASPGAALALTAMNTETDIRHVLPVVRVPTLVLHRTGDRCLRIEEGRYVASRIPGAQLVELPGEDHLPFVGDQDAILQHMEEFLLGLPDGQQASGVLATVLVAEFEGSMDERVQTTARNHLSAFGARESEFAWPRVAAGFNGPARALHCARAIVASCQATDVRCRIGLHTGELVLRPGVAMAGSAVVVANRVLACGAWNQVLATGTLRDLAAGSGIPFAPLGRVEAQGIGEWQLLEVTNFQTVPQ